MDQAGVSAKMILWVCVYRVSTFRGLAAEQMNDNNYGRSWVAIVPRTPEAPCPINSTKSAAWRAPAIDAPCEAQKTGDGGADAIDQKHPDLPLRGEGQLVRRPQRRPGRRGHDGGQRAREHDGRDPGPARQPRRDALDPHSRRSDDDETIEPYVGDRPVDELPCQGEGGEKASFEHQKLSKTNEKCRIEAQNGVRATQPAPLRPNDKCS